MFRFMSWLAYALAFVSSVVGTLMLAGARWRLAIPLLVMGLAILLPIARFFRRQDVPQPEPSGD